MRTQNDAHDCSLSCPGSSISLSPASTFLKEHTGDIFMVDWDGPDDPQNPKNWSVGRKWMTTAIMSGFTFLSPVSSSMIAPATGQLAVQFGVHSSIILALTTSIFILGFALGPLLFGPLSEIYGRSCVLKLCNLWYLVWNLGCGFVQNESQLLTFRFLASLGASAPLVIGGGVLGDCWREEERGKAVAVYTLVPLLGPALGPLTGAWIAQCSTWKWVFRSTSILDGVVLLFSLFYFQETFAPIILERKADELRKSMDTEKGPRKEVRTIYDEGQDRSWKATLSKSMVRPFMMFAREPILQLLGVYMAFIYGTLYIFLTVIPTIFEDIYDEPVGVAGLHYLALGIGIFGGLQVNVRTLDKIYIYLKEKNGDVGRPEFRLPAMFVGSVALPIGLLITGWTIQARVHWIAPDIGMALVGLGFVLSLQCIQVYTVDAFTFYAASAMAAVVCLRSLAGAGFPLFAPAMYSALGYGNGNTVLAVAAIVIGCPAPWVLWRFGERIRNASRYAQ